MTALGYYAHLKKLKKKKKKKESLAFELDGLGLFFFLTVVHY